MQAKRVFEGLTVVTVGVILLCNTLGVLPWSVWWAILMLWPLLIVSAGVDILGRAVNSSALRVLASLVVIGGLVYGALTGAGYVTEPQPAFGGGAARSFSFSQPLGTERAGRAKVSAGLARVTLAAAPAGVLASARGETPFGRPAFSAGLSGGTADVSMDSASASGVAFPGTRRSFLDGTLSAEVRWERVQVDAGMSEVRLDLSRLDAADLVVNTGMSNTEVRFGGQARVAAATISGGLSAYTLRVPSGLGVELRADNGLGSVKVPSGWTRISGDGVFSGVWRSDGYDASTSKLLLTVKAGLSSVDVERY